MADEPNILTDSSVVPCKKRKQVWLSPIDLSLITCEFDESILQMSGLLASLTSKLEANWQSSTIQYLTNSNDPLERSVSQQLPPLIQPKTVGLSGLNGSVPISFSFTWTRYQPTIDLSTKENESKSTDDELLNIKLNPFIEPEVVILLTADQIKNLLIKSSSDTKQKLHENANLIAFGTSLMNLKRPVTCIFLTGPTFKSKTNHLSSSSSSKNISSSYMSINELCAELQLNWHVHSTRVTSNLHDVAMILNAITRSLAERQFKQGRLERDEGLSFLPNTVHKGLSGCASRGRGPGKAPITINNDSESLTANQEQNLHLWSSRVWLGQLGQWRGLTGEIAHAITLVYPTIRSFYNACKLAESTNYQATLSSSNQFTEQKYIHPFEIELANLEIRRGVGVLSTKRRLGPEFARRLIKLFTSKNPNEIVN
ncbi:crossover junction endonuclease EME1 [Schistosoma bovis]|uniref:Crossover junction endonuclease EME1 n=1 Tax=Schistosoma bovis TaxID=6184 RepID=A0A430Q4K1_SCHBO|nr:crossover junction endonuclease EME1 [Schistosoma bovis]